MFGLMSLVIAIRVGMELVSDLGITQNIVSNPRGHEPKFYDTAWTLHATRNLVLAALCFALATPFANFFGHPELAIILPVASLFFVFSGFGSTTGAVLHKQLQVRRLGMFEIALAGVTIAAQVGAALVFRNVWAVVVGMMITSAVTLILPSSSSPVPATGSWWIRRVRGSCSTSASGCSSPRSSTFSR